MIIGFHNPDEENGYLSNWALSHFTLETKSFSSMEQFMMVQKAVCFNDLDTAAQIMNTTDVRQIKDKLDLDYNRLNEMERWKMSMQRLAADSLEEREILMQALLGVLGGLQEIGANGPTKAAEAKIRDYLNKKAHMPDD